MDNHTHGMDLIRLVSEMETSKKRTRHFRIVHSQTIIEATDIDFFTTRMEFRLATHRMHGVLYQIELLFMIRPASEGGVQGWPTEGGGAGGGRGRLSVNRCRFPKARSPEKISREWKGEKKRNAGESVRNTT